MGGDERGAQEVSMHVGIPALNKEDEELPDGRWRRSVIKYESGRPAFDNGPGLYVVYPKTLKAV